MAVNCEVGWPQPSITIHHYPQPLSFQLATHMGPIASHNFTRNTGRVVVQPLLFPMYGTNGGSRPAPNSTASETNTQCSILAKKIENLAAPSTKTIVHKRSHSECAESDPSAEPENVVSPAKRQKRPNFFVKGKEMQAFFALLYDSVIHDFLTADACRKISDKYLLAMAFAYFKRAGLSIREYTRTNFFIALYLASDVEEDEEDFKYEIFPWALGKRWKERYMTFLSKRDKFWKKIEHRAVVSRKCCEEIMAIESDHWAWKRDRPEHHSGAVRCYDRDDSNLLPRGPDRSPRQCKQCAELARENEASMDLSWYLTDGSDSEEEEGARFLKTVRVSSVKASHFDLEDLRETFQSDARIWATIEE